MLSKFQKENGLAFSWKTILYSVFYWYKWRCNNKRSKISQNFKQLSKGHDQLLKELDIYQILNSIRNSNILVSVLFDEKQKILWKYQHSNLIDMNEKIKENISESDQNSFTSDQMKSDIDLLISNGGIDWTHEVNRILTSGVEGKSNNAVYPIQ